MDDTQGSGEQARLWNGPAGQAWVNAQDLLDRMFTPLEDLLAAVVSSSTAAAVLDVGCGAGSTTLAIARVLAPEGRAIGIDISDQLIAAARARAGRERLPVAFIRADAQDHPFEPGSVDMIVSRFGVMFFPDPVLAFANLHRAARADAALRVIAWRSPAENPFMTLAERAAAPLLPNLPSRRLDGPGQFAFADRQRVHALLSASGWTDIDIQPIDVPCSLPAEELNRYLTQLGPVGLALQDADDVMRARILEAVRPAFDGYVQGAVVRFTAACWMIGAQARGRRTALSLPLLPPPQKN